MAQPVALSFAAYKRSGFPEAVTVNCYAEKAPTSQSQPLALIARPGLEAFAEIGTAPIRAIFQKPGLFNDAALIVAETGVHTLSASAAETTLAGVPVAGDDLVEIDAGQDADLNAVAYIATGDGLYKVTGGTVTREAFPDAGDDVGASSVCFHRGFWIAVKAGTDVFYFQLPGATTWGALQFASAEYNPDRLECVRSFGDMVLLLGQATTEVWRLSGTADAFEPYGGLQWDFGCRARATAVNCQGALIWVDSNCQLRLFDGGEPRIISDNGLTEQIRRVGASSLRASFAIKDGHPIYTLTLGTEATWAYDLSTQLPVRFDSLGFAAWRAQLFCNIGDTVLAADSASNQIYRLDPDRRTDGDDTFTMRFTAFLEASDGPIPLANVELHCEVGGSPRTGQGSDPLVGMRMSRDNGKTWGPWRYRSLGLTGQYGTRVRYNALGTAYAPYGVIFEFMISDPVVRRVSGLWANAA